MSSVDWIIEPYADGDEAAVCELWGQVFSDAQPWNDPLTDIRRKLAVQRRLFLVARAGASLVGTAMAGYDGHRGWIYYLAVSPAWRRRGIGAALMSQVESELAALGCIKLNLQVRGGNREAVAFYEKLGYGIEERVSMGKRLPARDPASS